jgi:hypothetical protein
MNLEDKVHIGAIASVHTCQSTFERGLLDREYKILLANTNSDLSGLWLRVSEGHIFALIKVLFDPHDVVHNRIFVVLY